MAIANLTSSEKWVDWFNKMNEMIDELNLGAGAVPGIQEQIIDYSVDQIPIHFAHDDTLTGTSFAVSGGSIRRGAEVIEVPATGSFVIANDDTTTIYVDLADDTTKSVLTSSVPTSRIIPLYEVTVAANVQTLVKDLRVSQVDLIAGNATTINGYSENDFGKLNLLKDSGRNSDNTGGLALHRSNYWKRCPLMIDYNGGVSSEGDKFIFNNTDNGGSAGLMGQDMKDLLTFLGNSGDRYGIEYYITDYAAGSDALSSNVGADAVERYLATVNGSVLLTENSSIEMLFRVKTGSVHVSTDTHYKNNVSQVSGQNYDSTDGWFRLRIELRDIPSAYNNAQPNIYATIGCTFQYALPVVTTSLLPMNHTWPISTIGIPEPTKADIDALGVDAATVDGIEPFRLRGVSDGDVNDSDPDTDLRELFLTNHANSPGAGYWHIRTQFYGSNTLSSARVQTAIEYIGGTNFYVRGYHNGTWTAWNKLSQEKAEIDALGVDAATLVGKPDTSFVRHAQSHNEITNLDNLDDFLTPGIYAWANASPSGRPNAAQTYGFLLVEDDGSQKSQVVFGGRSPNSGTIYQRRRDSGVWGTWNSTDMSKADIDALGVDAATLDGIDSSSFLRSDVEDIKTSGKLKFNDNIVASFGTGGDFDVLCNGSNAYMDMKSTGVGSLFMRDGTTPRFTFARASGDFTATGNVTAYSDINLKSDFQLITNALYKVNSLNGYTFERTDVDVPRQAGVIAQEVEKVLPEVVSTDENGIKSVAYGNMVGLLIEAVKELSAKVEELEKRIDSAS